METTTFNKLVRDRIPEIIERAGKRATVETLSDADFLAAVDAKLQEELDEYLASGDTTELADLLETLYAAASARGVGVDELERIRLKKREERGGFELKLFLKEVISD
ncbi:MAG: nucleoside triphosphate pyrophosphohydrolase [Thermoguttaceae bacterium]|nr:nucleoside triphosphate pyrophosphohydrolase [Thermoguttaceae bacterium]